MKIILDIVIPWLIYMTEILRSKAYTERVSKIGILTRRRHDLESGFAGAEAAQLIKLGDAGGFKVIGCRRRQKPIFEIHSVYHNWKLMCYMKSNLKT